MSQHWRGGPPRFSDERKPLVERPAMLGTYTDEFCWCGGQHSAGSAGLHPWGPLDLPVPPVPPAEEVAERIRQRERAAEELD